MSREIKFRVWDDSPKKDGYSGLMISHEYAMQSSYLENALNGKHHLMQFTGLHDKNGKEIYEGDIVCPFSLENKGNKCVIVYEFNQFRIKGKNVYWNWYFQELEIIGNIYENPELL